MENFAKLFTGMSRTFQKKITIDDTALNYGSGKIQDLFATPRLVAFMIEASAQLIDTYLPDGYVSVSNSIEVDHYKSTLVGSTVTVEVVIAGFENGKYQIIMTAYDEFGQIGSGKHSRSVVNYRSLMLKAEQRTFENHVAG